MRYEEPDQDTENTTYESRPQYVSDNTAFMRWSTEIEQIDNIIDSNFLKRNNIRIIDLDKFLPLSNITNKKNVQLFRLRRMIIQSSVDAGLTDVAEDAALSNLADYQMSRGIGGFYQNALITQKREWMDRSREQKKTGILKGLISGRKEESRMQTLEE